MIDLYIWPSCGCCCCMFLRCSLEQAMLKVESFCVRYLIFLKSPAPKSKAFDDDDLFMSDTMLAGQTSKQNSQPYTGFLASCPANLSSYVVSFMMQTPFLPFFISASFSWLISWMFWYLRLLILFRGFLSQQNTDQN